MPLEDSLRSLPPPLRARLEARGFRDRDLLARAAELREGKEARAKKNRLAGLVEPPRPGDVEDVPAAADAERFTSKGSALLAEGKVALCVLAGGMATRMGGVVKALVPLYGEASAPPPPGVPASHMGKTFLDARLAEIDAWARKGKAPPLWLMTSEATDGPIRAALASRGRPLGDELATFEQCVSLRLRPDGELFETESAPSVYATGHGDLLDALRTSGLLARFVARGGEWVWIANLDNLGATLDAAILGQQVESGAALAVELVDKVGTDRGGGPVRHEGRKLITEEFRLPAGFDPASVPVFNTNTFLARAADLSRLAMDFTWVMVEKEVGGQKAVQFERLVGEITRELEPRWLRVPREGAASRFLPVKDVPELERRRPEIRAVLEARGIAL